MCEPIKRGVLVVSSWMLMVCIFVCVVALAALLTIWTVLTTWTVIRWPLDAFRSFTAWMQKKLHG